MAAISHLPCCDLWRNFYLDYASTTEAGNSVFIPEAITEMNHSDQKQSTTLLSLENIHGTENCSESLECKQANENRQEDRVDYRTTGLAYRLGEEGLKPIGSPVRIWTVDVSTMGCLIRSHEEIESGRVLIKLILPQLKETLLEASIVRNVKDRAKFLNGKEKDSHLYGVKFHRMLKLSELQDSLPEYQVSQQQTEDIDSTQADEREENRSAWTFMTIDSRVITVGLLGAAAVLVMTLVTLL